MGKTINNYKELIEQGYGQGKGSNYTPCKTVQNFSSIGRSHRVQGRVSGRIHHLFSDLELSTLLLLDWNQNVTDIREHFPLNISDLNSICSRYRMKRISANYFPFTLCTDFLVSFGSFEIALETLYSKDLNTTATIESLEIKRRYWQEEYNTPFKIITEKDIPVIVTKNITWLYAEKYDLEINQKLIDITEYLIEEIKLYPTNSLLSFCKHMDHTEQREIGYTLGLFRKLFALRLLEFNLEIPHLELKLENIQAGSMLQPKDIVYGVY